MKADDRNAALDRVFGGRMGLRVGDLAAQSTSNFSQRNLEIFGNKNDAELSAELRKMESLKDIQDIQDKIDNQNQFNKELNDFINSGLELANKSQTSDCPLCSHKYNTFEKLSENILSNKLLDNELKKYLKEKNDKESKINKLSLQLSVQKEKIEKEYSVIKQPYLSDYKNIQNVIDKFYSERKSNLEKLNSNQSILNNINFTLKTGDFFGIVGPSGAGKSTMLKIIAGLLDADTGKVLLDGALILGPKDKLIA
jgi:ABC-type multidrug transport system fused ATPase/permease subunit